MQEPSECADRLAHDTIGAAIAVHRALGPGFTERMYENALCIELDERKVPYKRQVPLPMFYRGHPIGEFITDLVVGELVVVELKAVEGLAPNHAAQLHSYLRASRIRLGLLMNFNVPILRNGIKRIILSERPAAHTP